MPVNVRSIHGKVDYSVEQTLQELAAQSNTLETMVTRLRSDVAGLQAQVGTIIQQLAELQRRFDASQ